MEVLGLDGWVWFGWDGMGLVWMEGVVWMEVVSLDGRGWFG